MSNINDDTYEYTTEFTDYKNSYLPYEFFQRERPPFLPIPDGGRPPFLPVPSAGRPPSLPIPNTDIPPIADYPPTFNYPGGGFTPPGIPKAPPPDYLPNKTSAGVQSLSSSGGDIGTKAVSPNSIRFCLFKYTYIWEVNRRNYWAYLLNVDRRSVSGFRWTGRNWIYFGVDLRRIDSFVCYRSTSADAFEGCNDLRQDDISLLSSKKDYSLNGTRDVYTQTLASIDIPEVKEDFVVDRNVIGDIPYVKTRSTGYRITLEVTYPNDYDIFLKNKINEFANEASTDAHKIISSTRGNYEYSNPLEIFNSSLSLIPEALIAFSTSFNNKLQMLVSSAYNYDDIIYSIREEKINANWKPCFYEDCVF